MDGKEWWVGLAKKTSKAGKVYLALTFRPKVGEAGPKPKLDDEISFEPRIRSSEPEHGLAPICGTRASSTCMRPWMRSPSSALETDEAQAILSRAFGAVRP